MGRSSEVSGWLLDLYPDPQDGHLSVWLLCDDGKRRRLRQRFPVAFYASGPCGRLRALWTFLNEQPGEVFLARTERWELGAGDSLPVLEARTLRAGDLPRLFRLAREAFRDLEYYDADVPLLPRYAALFDVFPLTRCRAEIEDGEWIRAIEPIESRWALDPEPPPLRILELAPDCDPFHAPPTHVLARCGRFDCRLALEPARPLLANLASILTRFDPDLILTEWGDTWLLPRLLKEARGSHKLLPAGRDPALRPIRKAARTYHSYGQMVHRGQQVILHGRLHVDRQNAMMWGDYGLDGIIEMARVSGLPVQTAARNSPGAGITAMQIITALREDILVPYRKQQPERPKSASDLIRADMGGLVYQPLIGLYEDVAEIDAVSMYPSILVKGNLSPETIDVQGEHVSEIPGINMKVSRDQEGFLPRTIRPLLEKRIALKARLADLKALDCRFAGYKARSAALKWLLVVCFGYTGYRNAKFGRIEAHQAITAYAREALLRAKEAAEDMGFEVLHMYVDCVWVRKPGAAAPDDFRPLIDEIASRTGLPMALDGVFKWVAFLPSRMDSRVGVANRYFGLFQSGEIKVRGIESRRRDTPPFVAETQSAILRLLAKAPDAAGLPEALPAIVDLLRSRLRDLRAGRVDVADLVLRLRLSREVAEYRSPSPAALAAAQLEDAGKSVQVGQSVKLIFTRGEPRAVAWDLPGEIDPRRVDVRRYTRLLLRAAATVLTPLGVDEALLQAWVDGSVPVGALPVQLPIGPALPLPRFARLPADLGDSDQDHPGQSVP